MYNFFFFFGCFIFMNLLSVSPLVICLVCLCVWMHCRIGLQQCTSGHVLGLFFFFNSFSHSFPSECRYVVF